MRNSSDLISSLANDLKNPSDARYWGTQFWFSWISCLSVMALLSYLAAAYLPEYIHLPHHPNGFFWAEVVSWFGISFFSALVAYRSSIPGKTQWPVTKLAYGMSFLLVVFLFIRWNPSAIAEEVSSEMHLMQGPCGLFVMVTGIFAAFWMLFIVRRAAPLRLGFTSLWSVVSVGTLGTMFMHMVCTHESSVHVFIWHLLPLFALISILSLAGKKILRW